MVTTARLYQVHMSSNAESQIVRLSRMIRKVFDLQTHAIKVKCRIEIREKQKGHFQTTGDVSNVYSIIKSDRYPPRRR